MALPAHAAPHESEGGTLAPCRAVARDVREQCNIHRTETDAAPGNDDPSEKTNRSAGVGDHRLFEHDAPEVFPGRRPHRRSPTFLPPKGEPASTALSLVSAWARRTRPPASAATSTSSLCGPPFSAHQRLVDTSAHLSDSQIAAALAVEHTALGAAAVLSRRHGRLAAAHDVRHRIQASHSLQRIQQLGEQVRMREAVATCSMAVAKRKQERARVVEEWNHVREERVRLCELRRARNAARCGAKTRTGTPCRRRPELGRTRCRSHGGLSTGARTPEGRARALATRKRGRETQRLRLSSAP
jgi:hypothetical protein